MQKNAIYDMQYTILEIDVTNICLILYQEKESITTTSESEQPWFTVAQNKSDILLM